MWCHMLEHVSSTYDLCTTYDVVVCLCVLQVFKRSPCVYSDVVKLRCSDADNIIMCAFDICMCQLFRRSKKGRNSFL